MVNLAETIAANSKQLNADDLVNGPINITINKVTKGETAEQPINIFYEGCDGKPWRPCKSMRRVLVNIWGPDGATYPGKSLALYREPNVKFGSLQVGGIRISHASHISGKQEMAITVTQGKKARYSVEPLRIAVQARHEATEATPPEAPAPSRPSPEQWVASKIAQITACQSLDALKDVTGAKAYTDAIGRLKISHEALHGQIVAAASSKADSPHHPSVLLRVD